MSSLLRILQSVVASYRAAYRAFVLMWPMVATVLAVNTSLEILWARIFGIFGYSNLLVMGIVNFGFVAARCFFSTPLAIAIHRFVLLGEVTRRFAPTLGARHFWRYFAWLFLLTSFGNLGFYLCLFGQSAAGAGLATSHFAEGVGWLLWVRLVLLFPAIAIETPSANWRNAMRTLEGHGWSVFFVLVAALLPVALVNRLVQGSFSLALFSNENVPPLAHEKALALMQIVSMSLFAVIGSRHYLKLATTGELQDASSPAAPKTAGTRRANAACVLLVAGVFVVVRESYVLPLEARLPPSAAYEVGRLYDTGLLVEQSHHEALRWYSMAAKQGHAKAQTEIGDSYERGYGLPKDYAQAARWYRSAAEQGNALAQARIGILYEYGSGVAQDDVEAVHWFWKAADQQQPEAEAYIGYLYEYGRGVAQDYAAAMQWYRIAADHGNPMAQNNIGWLYERGRGVARDYAEAIEWYWMAAKQDYAMAQYNIGALYEYGRGVRRSYAEAMRWYRLAADQRLAVAQWRVGVFYEFGAGVPQDYGAARHWYRLAADQDLAWAQTYLGLLYLSGKGAAQDYAAALIWLRRAAEAGDAKAQFNLGRMYEYGWGVSKDSDEADLWIEKAAAGGNVNAKRWLDGIRD